MDFALRQKVKNMRKVFTDPILVVSILIVLAVVTLFIVMPLVNILKRKLFKKIGQFSLEHYKDFSTFI